MYTSVCPATDGILRRVLPGLQSIAMIEIVRRLPIVEDLVAVLDWCKESSYDVGGREDIEGNYRLELEGGLWSLRKWSRGDGHPLSWWWRGHCVEPGTGGQLHALRQCLLAAKRSSDAQWDGPST